MPRANEKERNAQHAKISPLNSFKSAEGSATAVTFAGLEDGNTAEGS